MNKVSKTICFLSALTVIAACGGASTSAPKEAVESKTLNQELEDIKRTDPLDIADLQGSTQAERLLYLLDVPTATKSGILIVLDSQIKSFEQAGNKEVAAELRRNKALLRQAADDVLDEFVTESAKVYEDFFTEDELSQLIKIFSQPLMQKYTSLTVDLQQKLVPVAEKWVLHHVTPRYTGLLKEQGGN